ncbi:MAG: xanthine dehydrogenase family protein molybdopterin-binding subunit [Anaerolineae bacterium]|nr:xanthine dehydrogenase family protein molybdopterin-binding subunit [Anaerolineae bacterium]
MSTYSKSTRRDFLKASALVGTGLVLGFRLPDAGSVSAATTDYPVVNLALQPAGFVPNAYLGIDPDGVVTVQVHRSEMGQGVNTALPMIIAEELEADWSLIRIVQSPADRIYGSQVTGGSQSIQSSYDTLRRAGAAARMMLIAAAAQLWDVSPDECYAQNGTVIHEASGQQFSYGELVETAAALPVPERGDLVLKDPADFRIIGTRQGNLDNPAYVDGSAVFASDIQLPGMLVAAVEHCPWTGGRAASFDASAAEAVAGVRHVISINGDRGIAVVADTTWAALKGRELLQVEWERGNPEMNTDDLRQQLLDRFELANTPDVIEAIYEVSYMAHASMEPMVCVADVREDHCEVWAPTQDRQGARDAARSLSGMGNDAITIHVPLIGGAFGRRLENDYVSEAVAISQAVGAPVKLFWTREDDMRNDYYHPMVAAYLSAPQSSPTSIQGRGGEAVGLRTGAWRSVGEHPEAFARECFVDEVAEATGRDPLTFRLLLNAGTPRQAVLELAAEKAGWGSPLPDGWGRGIAVHSTFDITHVAQVAEVSVSDSGRIRVHRVVCAVDCGTVINPDLVEAQMEGGIVFGLTAALYSQITVKDGRVQQGNFYDYPLLRMDEMPEIEVYFVPSDRSPTGVGEMGVPPTAPAVFNAVYAATGKRLRHLPVQPEDLQ